MDELRALRAVVAVADDLSFSRAARRLRTTQPTVSRLVRTFEDAHGVVVFDRSTRSVALTDAGRALVERAVVAIEQADEAVRAAQRVAAGELGTVRLGYVTGAANALLPGIFRRLRSSAPGVEVRPEHGSVTDLVARLRRRRIDIALVRLPSEVGPDLVVDTVVPDHLVAAVPDTGQLAGGDALTWAELAAHPMVLWPRAMAPGLHDRILHELRQRGGTTPRLVVQTRDTVALLALVAAGVGATLVTAGTASALRRAGVVYRDLPDPLPVPLAVIHRPHPGGAVDAVLAACRAGQAYPSETESPIVNHG